MTAVAYIEGNSFYSGLRSDPVDIVGGRYEFEDGVAVRYHPPAGSTLEYLGEERTAWGEDYHFYRLTLGNETHYLRHSISPPRADWLDWVAADDVPAYLRDK